LLANFGAYLKRSFAFSMPDITPLLVRREGGKIWSHVRQMLLVETPEERVRQEYLCVLVNEYGYSTAQIGEEVVVTGRGAAQARADFLVWRSAQDKTDNKAPLLVVECKSDNVTVSEKDYRQGEAYARQVDAPFLVTHNSRETKYWRVRKERMPGYLDEIENIPAADASDKDIKALFSRLKTFREDEFAKVLGDCHDIIRNEQHLDPAAAFDEIAKMLFIKVDQERKIRSSKARENKFTVAVLDEFKDRFADPLEALFKETLKSFKGDNLFTEYDQVQLRYTTARQIVRKLEAYNLSDTSEDVKGIAFEKFLGGTFRGEIGQFFTPRSIVEFMIRMIDPKEGEVICDPASGSGGFLIRFFEIVREKILAQADEEYEALRAELETQGLSDDVKAQKLREKDEERKRSLDASVRDSKLWRLANLCIFGTDANERMARTSKMNMIMHGDGHGGVHHHNGLLNVNGIFEERFDIILTNPPFGAVQELDRQVQEVAAEVSDDQYYRYSTTYGDAYIAAFKRLHGDRTQKIGKLFTLTKDTGAERIPTEILFVERCLNLLKPGGRMGIVLPEGIFNNPSAQYIRTFVEDRAYLRAVVSLPQETFKASGADVKTSLLFIQKFSVDEQGFYNGIQNNALLETRDKYAVEIDTETKRLQVELTIAKVGKVKEEIKAATAALRKYEKDMEAKIQAESRALLKSRFRYPIFLYEAERVGITATGAPDATELFPNPNLPAGVTVTCLELYQEFLKDNESFFATGPMMK
jgi:type I restriction enzyme M protein